MAVKLYRRLMNKQLRIGTGLASRSILINFTENTPKIVSGLTTAEVTDNKDAMNFGIVEKACSDKVLTKLINPQEYGTKVYLELNRHIIRAYIDDDVSPSERLHSAWYIAFFCRLWKESIIVSSKLRTGRDDLCKISLKDSFISTNLHVCIELNGHAITRFMVRCRDLGKPEIFLPNQTGSQPCEGMFRTLRSMTSMFYTSINFDIMEIMQKVKRVLTLNAIATSKIDFNFARQNKTTKTFVPKELPTNAEIDKIVFEGWKEAQKVLCNLSK